MKIIHLAPVIEPLSEKAPGGAEQVVVSLASAQHAAGHQVEIVAATGSTLPEGITYHDVGIRPGEITPIDTSGEYSKNSPDAAHNLSNRLQKELQVFSAAKKFLRRYENEPDVVVHTHAFDAVPLFEFNDLSCPLLHTLHCPPIAYWICERLRTAHPPANVCYVTVSNLCAGLWQKQSGFLPKVVHNGIQLSRFAFSERPQNHFLWVGRISPEKGLHTAIDLTGKIPGAKIRVLGRVYHEEYYEREIRNRLTQPHVDYHGFCSQAEVAEEMRNAKALLAPIEWDEPFGLVVVESLASGTPVIAYRRGATPEIITSGRNGYIADTADEFLTAMMGVDSLSRPQCRASVEEQFSAEAMSRGYLRLYRNLSDSSQN